MPVLPPNVLLYNPPNLRRKDNETYTLAGQSRFQTQTHTFNSSLMTPLAQVGGIGMPLVAT